VYACLLPYEDSLIVRAVCIDYDNFQGVIALLVVEYFIKKCVCQSQRALKYEFLKTVHACLLSYEDSLIVSAA